jgi:cyclic pyranopterin phosphate synthase
MQELSHLNKQGEPKMVDVASKESTHRIAVAEGFVRFPVEVWNKLTAENWQVKKGGIHSTAILAGIMAGKKTHELIPLCHPLMISGIDVSIEEEAPCLRLVCTVKCDGKTGVEMEALTACSIAALTVYDMCKALSHDIQIEKIQLMSKEGGKHDFSRG